VAFPFGETETEMGHDDDKDAPDNQGACDERGEKAKKAPLMAWERELLGSFVREWLDAEVLDIEDGGPK
jgi:hypothetical protein